MRDPRVDAYIDKAAPFAQPILERLREAVHEACPDVEETLKWSMPSFVHAGGILAGMAAFKQHVSFGYWKHALVMGEGVQREGSLRWLSAQRAARLRGMDHRSEARGHPQEAAGAGGGVDGRGQAAALETREMLSGCGLRSSSAFAGAA